VTGPERAADSDREQAVNALRNHAVGTAILFRGGSRWSSW